MTLKKVPIFTPLSDKERQYLATHLSVRVFDNGEYIFKQGEEVTDSSGLYIIEYGQASITVNVPSASAARTGADVFTPKVASSGTSTAAFKDFSSLAHDEVVEMVEKEVAVLGEGSYVGEVSLIEKAPRSANVIAIGETTCYFMSKVVFETTLNNPETLQRIRLEMRCRKFVRENTDLLKKILIDAALKEVFHQFLKESLTTEIMAFYEDAFATKKSEDAEARKQMSKVIYAKYIDSDATMLINCPENERKLIRDRLDNPPIGIFDTLMNNAYKDLNKDVIPRFLESQLFKEWIKQEMIKDGTESAKVSVTAVVVPRGGGCCCVM